MKTLILASASPRRREILKQVGIDFTVIPSTKEEGIRMMLPGCFACSAEADIRCIQVLRASAGKRSMFFMKRHPFFSIRSQKMRSDAISRRENRWIRPERMGFRAERPASYGELKETITM